MKRYLFHYRYDGKEFGFDVPADSLDEAKGRVKAMTLARYEGELVATIPDAPGVGLLVRLITWVRNALNL
jgi:hypothetical protein